VAPGSLFVALVGERFDGHAFLREAADRGATGRWCPAARDAPEGMRLFEVDDTLRALGRLARHRRPPSPRAGGGDRREQRQDHHQGPGARRAVRALPRPRHRGQPQQPGGRSPSPCSPRPTRPRCWWWRWGTNEPGEIAILARIAEPDFGILTSIGEEHLEKLVSLEGVLEEELNLVKG
jgi:UDP-N-acetylmuramoyl-tripeptide--D-alanyl-D-alanine ligase